jgi:hypothetical protein
MVHGRGHKKRYLREDLGENGGPELVRTTEGLRTFIIQQIDAIMNNFLTSRLLTADDKAVLEGQKAYWQQASTGDLQRALALVPKS